MSSIRSSLQSTSRRSFLKSASAVSLTISNPIFFRSAPLFGSGFSSPNERMPIGLIGAGGMGVGNMQTAKPWVDVVAIADADEGRCREANQQLSEGRAKVFRDYRHILEREDIKLIHIATPDHWHTKPLVEAMQAGKDVYCEKPLTLTIDEGKLICKVQKQTGRIVQVGTQQRSTFNLFVKAIAMVAEGRLGKIRRIQCAIGGAPSSGPIPTASPPRELDWNLWLGPAPKADYRFQQKETKDGKQKTSNGHYDFRWWYEYSGGKLTDWGAHHVDIAVWALQVNGQNTAPVSIEGSARHPVEFNDGVVVQNDRYNTATEFNFSVRFADDVELAIRHDTDNGCLIEGDKGRIFVNRNKLVGRPVEELDDNPLAEDAIGKIYKGLPMESNERQAHWLNFLHCHRDQIEPISDVHSHLEMLNICHLVGICARLGRKLNWDADSESIRGDDQAKAMLSRPTRAGFEIES